tara:strand:+ start:6300 stop:6749 length:450 start_codon:yes stop_codon:yes gene_type:complete
MNKYLETAAFIKKSSGVDVFKNTRVRRYVEFRALYNYVLYNIMEKGLTAIRDLYIENGKPYDHATVLHSLKMFDVYKKYNPKILPLLDEISFELYNTHDNKLTFIKNSVKNMDSKEVRSVADFIKIIVKNKIQDEAKKNSEVPAEPIKA